LITTYSEIEANIARIILAELRSEYKATSEFTKLTKKELFVRFIRYLKNAGIIRMEWKGHSTYWHKEKAQQSIWTAELKSAMRNIIEDFRSSE